MQKNEDVISENSSKNTCERKHIETVEKVDMIESSAIGIIEKWFFVGNDSFAHNISFCSPIPPKMRPNIGMLSTDDELIWVL